MTLSARVVILRAMAKIGLPTWVFELSVVYTILSAVVVLTNGSALEWIAVGAVTASFAHGQVAERMAAKEAAREKPDVHCHAWSTRYFVGKEILWFVYFAAKGSYAALAGVVLFLLYPVWRKLWKCTNEKSS